MALQTTMSTPENTDCGTDCECSMQPGKIGWNELMTSDPAGAIAYYTQLFGWETEPFPMPQGEYTMFKQNGVPFGGVLKAPQPDLPTMWVNYVCVENVDASVEKSTSLGGEVCCIAIAVDTTFAPFVVRNPEHGKSKGHVIDFEIPWRSGSRIRSARRDEIIRLLATDFTSPDIEVLKASITSSAMAAGKMFCQLEIEFYIMPLSETRLELPLHRIQGALKPDISDDWFKIRDFNFRGLYSGELTTIGGSRQFRRSADEKFIVTSSGITVMAGTKGHVTAKLSIPEDTWHIANSFDVLFSFEAGRERIPFDLTCSIDKNAGAAP